MRRRGALLALTLAAALSGCFGVDARLAANGSGAFDILYVPGRLGWTIEEETARWRSPDVAVTSVERREGGARVRATFDDVTRLSSAAALRHLVVTRARRANRERLQIRLRNPEPREVKPDAADDPWLTLSLPGPVTWANRDAEVRGERVDWQIPLVEWARAPVLVLTVRYTLPSS
jgi:hypothetical protein